METATYNQTQEVLNHHLTAFAEANVDEIMKDYDEVSELMTPDGVMKGLNAIRSFFEGAFKIIPKGSAMNLKQMIIRDNLAYLAWSCESPFVSVPLGTDTFIVENDKIVTQTLAAHIIPK